MMTRVACATAFACTLAFASAAMAVPRQGDASSPATRSSLGLGTELSLGSGLLDSGCVTATLERRDFHVDALLGFAYREDHSTALGFGGRVYFVLHRARSADLSVGGGLATVFIERDVPPGQDDDDLAVLIEAGGKLRFFPASNVAVYVTLGMRGQFVEDNTAFFLGGRVAGSAGITYFL